MAAASNSSESEHQQATRRSMIPDGFFQVPVHCLQHRTLTILATHLNRPLNTVASCGHVPDYTGLAALMGFDALSVAALVEARSSSVCPTRRILQEWSANERNASVGELVMKLTELERWDIFRDAHDFIEDDVRIWIDLQERRKKETAIQDTEVSSTALVETDDKLFTKDLLFPTDPPVIYDGFLSYNVNSTQDCDRMLEIAEHLEKEGGLKIARGSIELVVGATANDAYANAIRNRCRRVVPLISESFKQCEECNFQLQNAFATDPASLRRKVVPVLLDQVDLPRVLQQVIACRYYRKDLRNWFWPQLIGALRPSPLSPAPSTPSAPLFK